MPSMLVTVKISKGFETWTKMAQKMEKEMGCGSGSKKMVLLKSHRRGLKIIW